jgi:hypothetical protein
MSEPPSAEKDAPGRRGCVVPKHHPGDAAMCATSCWQERIGKGHCPAEPLSSAEKGQTPHFTEFLEKALEDPEVRAAYEAANQRPQHDDGPRGETVVGPAAETSQADHDRRALAELVTPNGFVLGDVIAQTILASDWYAERVLPPDRGDRS